ncbi:MAG: class II SORL domain-containing protein [Spirochaetia bacterium]
MGLGNHIKTDDFKNEKHVPVIEVGSDIKKGENFTVTVTVGKEIEHPNKTEHYIKWIALYYMPEGGNFIYELGKNEFSAHGASVKGADTGPAYSDPATSFTVKVDAPGTLIAESYCNIHGLWESKKAISL